MAKNIEEENATIQSNKTMVHKSNFADRYKVIDNPGARKIIKVERDIADIVNPKEADRSQQRDFQIR